MSYAIGVSKPISIFLKTDDASNVDTHKLIKIIHDNVDLSPAGIRKFLKLDSPIYEKTATYGHFGRTFSPVQGHFSWEELSLVDIINQNYK